jgi:predicted nucleotide-binding protein
MPISPKWAAVELSRLRRQAEEEDVQRDGPEHVTWRQSVDAVMANSLPATSTTLQEFRNISYHIGVYFGAPEEDLSNRQYFASQVRRAAALIDSAIYELELLSEADISPVESGTTTTIVSGPVGVDKASIFVVHGHDGARKYEVTRLLERTTSLDVVILHEQPNKGATVIEKLERHAGSAAFAVVLLTGDDVGKAKSSSDLRPRGRQNVILEAGLFFGLVGRSHVAVLYDADVELPSDLAGLIYLPLDEGGAWRLELLKEMEAVGIEVDRGRIP